MTVDAKTEALWLAVLHRMLHQGDSLFEDPRAGLAGLVDDELRALEGRGFVTLAARFWRATERGREVGRALELMTDRFARLEVFARVALDVTLDDDVSDDGRFVRGDAADPRFRSPVDDGDDAVDMRLALATCFSSASPLRVAFLQLMGEGRFVGDDVYFDLAQGAFWREIEELAGGAYRQSDASEDPAEALEVMTHVYEAGVIEGKKRGVVVPTLEELQVLGAAVF